MSQMWAQTRYAIDKLKAAGFKRNEYRVRIQKHYCGKHPETGRAMYEAADVDIFIHSCSRERQHNMIPAMLAAGLGVTVHTYAGRDGYSTVSDPMINDRREEQGKLTVLHVDRTDRDGFMIREVL